MPQHPLIDAYLLELRGQLPGEVVDELADGLMETYDHLQAGGLAPDQAARAALVDFGTTEEIVAGFAHLVPGRRTARALLASGPLLGGCWAITLLASHAWRWPIPVAGRVGFAALLLGVVAVLAMTARASYRHTRRSAALAGISGLLLLDASAIIAVTVLAPTPQWPLLLGITASLSRICLTAPTLRSLLITR
jgi:hypothetical protein